MSATELHKAGYKNLVCVIPPEATLSANSKIKPDQLGKCPGLRGANGWYGYSWAKVDAPTVAEAEQWDAWGANVGLLGTEQPGLDIDSDDPILTRVIANIAEEVLGSAPSRTGKPPRVLRVYRTDEPFSRMACVITYKGASHVVEMLGRGRQYLVAGKHPSGVAYEWDTPLWDVNPKQLNEVTPAIVMSFFKILQRKLGAKGIEVEIIGDGKVKEEKSPPQENLQAPSIRALQECVSNIPNTDELFPDRDDYILFGCAVKAAGGEEAYSVFLDWASRWDGGMNDPDTVLADWGRMHAPFRVGWNWLVERSGYSSAVDEFQADPNLAPRMLPEPLSAPEPAPEYPPELPAPERTDVWVADKILPELLPCIRRVAEVGKWHTWRGHKWESDRTERAEYEIQQAMVRLAIELHHRAESMPSKEADSYYRLARKLGSQSMIAAVTLILRRNPALALTVDQFDSDPWLLNTPGMMIDLKTGEEEPIDPAALCSRATAVAPEAGPAPIWDSFLHDTTRGDKALLRFVQKTMGYSLTGITREQTLSFIWGGEYTGKSVFIETMDGILGDYAETAAMDTFTSTSTDRHPTDLAKLVGARLVTASETQAGRAWDEQRVKAITGGDIISARFMRQDFFDYKPQFKLVIVGNHEPEIRNIDGAMRRRIHIVPFDRRVPDDKIDLDLAEKLREEWPQILAWLIEGCRLWREEGLQPPEVVLTRTARYTAGEDLIQQWIDECCEIDGESDTPRKILYNSWRQWAGEAGEQPGSAKQFKSRLDPKKPLGFSEVQVGSRRQRGYRGIKLQELHDEEDLV